MENSQETVTLSREKFDELKMKAKIDEELLSELVEGLEDIKSGKVRRVK
jgi:hypothetical protein